MADVLGFEPRVRLLTPNACLANKLFKPLTHTSIFGTRSEIWTRTTFRPKGSKPPVSTIPPLEHSFIIFGGCTRIRTEGWVSYTQRLLSRQVVSATHTYIHFLFFLVLDTGFEPVRYYKAWSFKPHMSTIPSIELFLEDIPRFELGRVLPLSAFHTDCFSHSHIHPFLVLETGFEPVLPFGDRGFKPLMSTIPPFEHI